MTLTASSHSVRTEKPEDSFAALMNQIRSWLDSRKIEPVEFKSDFTGPGSVALDIRFSNEDGALLFEREFA